MVAFASTKTKSIFSKLRFTPISQKRIQTTKICKKDDVCTKKERSSNNFFEAIKKGGVWLS